MTPQEIREANLRILEGYPDPAKRRACRALIEAYEAIDALDDWDTLETIVCAAGQCLPPDLNQIFYDTTHPDDDDEEED